MFKHNFKLAIKYAVKSKQTTLINIIGLAMGLASSLLIYLWITDELSFEKHHKNADQICQVYLKGTNENGISYQATSPPLIPLKIKESHPEILDYVRMYYLDEVVLNYNDNIFVENRGGAADQSVFSIFNHKFISGDPETALNDPYSVVLTESMATKYFGKQDPVGEDIIANSKYNFKVSAVIEDFPKNTYRHFDFFVPFEFLKNIGMNTNGGDFYPCNYLNYVLINEKTDLASLNTMIQEEIIGELPQITFQYELIPIEETYLLENGSTSKLIIFAILAIIILLLACINYTNLSIGYLASRVREIGAKRIFGVYRKQLVAQLIAESIIISFVALILALVLVGLLLNQFNAITNKNISFDFLNLNFVLFTISITFLTGLIAGLIPALKFSLVKPVDIIKNQISSQTSIGGFRKGLVVFQFIVTVFFVTSTIIIYKQSRYITQFDYGYNKDNIFYVRLQGSIRDKIPLLKQELLKNPQITHVASASVLPVNIYVGNYLRWGTNDISDKRIHDIEVDADFLNLFGLQLSSGRFFSEDFPGDVNQSIVLNQDAYKQLEDDNAVGKSMRFQNRNLNLIGVVKNFQHGSPLNSKSHPISFRLRNNNNYYLFVKINPVLTNSEILNVAIKDIKSVCDKYSPNRPLFYSFLNDFSYTVENRFIARSKLVLIGTIMAIVISIIGLFGLVFLSVNHRIREIGIRKVNGATISEVLGLISKEYLLLIVISFAISVPIIHFTMNKLLNLFANKIEISWFMYLLAGIMIITIALLTVSWQSLRAARKNPVEALRYE